MSARRSHTHPPPWKWFRDYGVSPQPGTHMGSNLVCYWVSCGRGSTRFLLLLKMDEVSFCMTQISHPELILKSVGDTPIETTGSGGGRAAPV